jgi:hypothetical protein
LLQATDAGVVVAAAVGNKTTRAKQNCGICSASPNVVQKDALMLRHLNEILHFRFFISAHQIKKKHAHYFFLFLLKIFRSFLFPLLRRRSQRTTSDRENVETRTRQDLRRRRKKRQRAARELAHRNKLVVCVDLH